jgi:hypothetical protein
MRSALVGAGLGSEETFAAVVDELKSSSAMRVLDTEGVQTAMAQRTAADPVFYERCELQCSTDHVETWLPPKAA